jgi:hypothetical protein
MQSAGFPHSAVQSVAPLALTGVLAYHSALSLPQGADSQRYPSQKRVNHEAGYSSSLRGDKSSM